MRALLPLLFLVPLLPIAHASVGDCPDSTLALGIIEINPVHRADATFYVDDRNYALGNGLWLYQESNGIWGDHTLSRGYMDLQRGGSSKIIPDDNEICTDDPNVEPDQLIE